MWAKIAGRPPSFPLKARTFPSEGKGDCSGSLTLAENVPSPTSAERQAVRASRVVEGSIWPIRQRGSPREERCPWRLIAIDSVSVGGGGLGAFEPIRPETLTETGAVPWRGSFFGKSLASTET